MKGRAPKFAFTGSHSELVQKRHPNLAKARCEPLASSIPIRMMRAKTERAMKRVTHLNIRSPRAKPEPRRPKTEGSPESEVRSAGPPLPYAAGRISDFTSIKFRSVLDRFDPFQNPLPHTFRQGCIVQRRSHPLAFDKG